ncbi:hypothetical protein Z517_06103 [Fonsecaea pedrosoi CBS 271.37]|uniref:Chromo domain-containing protein n=1 Tax=Fonsecaea pedrosoi CBS 271.37 TaxID=1442368 RepID=A0A0D2DP27_9EURO|nr:uncharacterized protein Z517_06103 [Fonsecaea pedrosoi CBS 271.37]KIW79491.1 hypothetical protein Z517_06103 [Fonsecaea pedrosoi CBS 271.37]
MKKRARTSSTADARPPKRQKQPKYTKRDPSPGECERLRAKYPRFEQAGEGSWPIETVLNHRRGRKKNTFEFKVQWTDHPETNEAFAPEWVQADALSEEVIADYWAIRKARSEHARQSKSNTEHPEEGTSRKTAASKRRASRRVQEDNSQIGQRRVTRLQSQISARDTPSTPSILPESESTREDSVPQSLSNPAPVSEARSDAGSDGEFEPGSDSDSDSESDLRAESALDLGPETDSVQAFEPAAEPTAGASAETEPPWKPEPATNSAAELGAATSAATGSQRQAEPESLLAARSASESRLSTPPHTLSGSRQEDLTNFSPSSCKRTPEPPAPISHPPSGSFEASALNPTRPCSRASEQESRSDGGLNTQRHPRVSAPSAEEGHPPEGPTSPAKGPQGRDSAEKLAVDSRVVEGAPVDSATQTSPLQQSHSGTGSSDFLARERLPPDLEKLRVCYNFAFRAPVLDPTYLGLKGTPDSRQSPCHMDFPIDTINNPTVVDAPEPELDRADDTATSTYDTLGGSALPIQASIEDEEHTSSGEQFSSESKASSSQQSVENERDVPQVAGLLPTGVPILGLAEYAIALPCEGRIQSTYSDIIKSKEKSIKKFLGRHDSVGSSSRSLTHSHERNEMNEMILHLHDTVTHMDLGLPGIPTHYPGNSQEHAAYANYAGSKFSFLGHLVDIMKNIGCSIIIMAREGPVQDLIEDYLKMKQVAVNRQDRMSRSKAPVPDRFSTDFQVELVTTWSTHQVSIYSRPILMIAFDASFDAQDPQIRRIRAHFSERHPNLMPVLHLLVANSSEHVDRCLPKSMPSPMRLKALVRATFQAWPNLGGKPVYLPRASDEPEGRSMDFSDLQRAIKKSPERKLAFLASVVMQAAISPEFDAVWNTNSMMPPLQLTDYKETPPKRSGINTRAGTPREPLTRSRTPLSRADTPSGRKRLLEADGVLPALQKRQRLTPLRDSTESSSRIDPNQVTQLRDQIKKLEADLESEKEARRKAEQDRDNLQEQLIQWKQDHAGLQHRYEKRMMKCHELEKQNKKTLTMVENTRNQNKRIAEEHATLKRKNDDLRKELANTRAEIEAGGGDAAAVEAARAEARTLRARNTELEKALENNRNEFEFTRTQYQEASNKAAEFANQIRGLEEEIATLRKLADSEKRRLKETNHQHSIKQHLDKIGELELECKSRDARLRKLEDENRHLKRNRGIQTRGSSAQPPGSPGLDGHGGRGTRSRQGSPAPGLFANSHHNSVINRGSLLRHER